MNTTRPDRLRLLALRRPLLRAAAAFLSAAAAVAQVQDHADVDLTPWSTQATVRCLKLASTNDGVVIAAFIVQGPPGQQWDRLVVLRSLDQGRTWLRHYIEPTGGLFYKDIALVVASGYRAPAQYDRWIYIAIETVNMHHIGGGISRVFLIFQGPVDQAWPGVNRYPWVNVIGGTLTADPARLDEPLHLTAAIVPYQENGNRDYMVVLAHRWVEAMDAVYINTPYRGAKGRTTGANWSIVAGPNGLYTGGNYAHPSIASDPDGRAIFLAFEDRSRRTVNVAFADPQTFRTGTGFSREFETDPRMGARSAPEIAVYNATAVMTCLGELAPRVPGAAELFWYWKQRAAPFAQKGMLHQTATSSAPLVMTEGQVFAVAHIVADPNPTKNPGFATAFTGRARDASLVATRVGDRAATSGRPTVAVTNGTDRGVFGYTLFDDWRTLNVQPPLVDPGQ